jgi:hypothetical protein
VFKVLVIALDDPVCLVHVLLPDGSRHQVAAMDVRFQSLHPADELGRMVDENTLNPTEKDGEESHDSKGSRELSGDHSSKHSLGRGSLYRTVAGHPADLLILLKFSHKGLGSLGIRESGLEGSL